MASHGQISTLERLLFSFTRVFVTVGVVITGIALILRLSSYFSVGRGATYVSHNEVKRALNPSEATSSQSLQESVPELTIPASLNKHMGDSKNREALLSWLEKLTEDQKRDFVSNLSEVIDTATAEKESDDMVYDVINKFKTLKLQKLSMSQFEQYTARITKAAALAFALAMAMLVAMMSLVLVLLAIERNTRSNAPVVPR